MVEDEEVLIGRPDVFEDEITITSQNIKKTYCTNCKKNQHCIHGIKGKRGPTVMLKVKCSNPNCECRCRRFFAAKNGRLLPLDTIDDTDPLEGFSKDGQRESIDDIIDKLNATVKKNVQVSQ